MARVVVPSSQCIPRGLRRYKLHLASNRREESSFRNLRLVLLVLLGAFRTILCLPRVPPQFMGRLQESFIRGARRRGFPFEAIPAPADLTASLRIWLLSCFQGRRRFRSLRLLTWGLLDCVQRRLARTLRHVSLELRVRVQRRQPWRLRLPP